MVRATLAMHIDELNFKYSPQQIATQPGAQFQAVLGAPEGPRFVNKAEVLKLFASGDLLVLNNTQVLKRCVHSSIGDIVFLNPVASPGELASSHELAAPHELASPHKLASPICSATTASNKLQHILQNKPHASSPTLKSCMWQVLFEAKKIKLGQSFTLPGGLTARLVAKGRPQSLQIDKPLDEKYFQRHARFALPPYILKARTTPIHNTRADSIAARAENNQTPCYQDEKWYQSPWAELGNTSKNSTPQPSQQANAVQGSLAAPTASLHFNQNDLIQLQQQGVRIAFITLHIGVGTFLPIESQNITQHKMHNESFFIPEATQKLIKKTKAQNKKIWALGTTVVRCLESMPQHGRQGDTSLFIHPGFKFQLVDALLTNFHQPRSSLLALVMAFAGRGPVIKTYEWAHRQACPLFSYGALSVWPHRGKT